MCMTERSESDEGNFDQASRITQRLECVERVQGGNPSKRWIRKPKKHC